MAKNLFKALILRKLVGCFFIWAMTLFLINKILVDYVESEKRKRESKEESVRDEPRKMSPTPVPVRTPSRLVGEDSKSTTKTKKPKTTTSSTTTTPTNRRVPRQDNRTDFIPLCSWNKEEPLYLPDQKDGLEQHFISWMNDWGVFYVLWNGVLLGAYRHHGKIPRDGDMDILFPVFLNYMTDDCDLVRRQRPKAFLVDPKTGKEADHAHPDEGFESRITLCNRTRAWWVNNISGVFQNRIDATGAKMNIKPRSFGGFRITFTVNGKNLGIDVVVSIWDLNFWRDATPTCRCDYRGQLSQCFESSMAALMRDYQASEKQLMNPQKKSVKNPKHPRWIKEILEKEKLEKRNSTIMQ